MPGQPLRTIEDFLDIERARRRWEISAYIQKTTEHPFAVGSRGDVFEARWGTSNVVVKVFRGTSEETLKTQKRLIRELAVWSILNHRNIAPFHGITFQFGPMPGIVSPFIHYDLMLFTEHRLQDRLRLVFEIASGLEYLHGKYVIHGDLKPANVRVSVSGVAQIIDFGMGKFDNVRGFTTSFEPNPRYMAPETFPSEEEDGIRLTFQSDVFSFGMLMLQVLHGRDIRTDQRGNQWDYSQPYNHIHSEATWSLWDRVIHEQRPLQDRYRGITQRQWELMGRCWHARTNQRPEAREIARCVQLDWYSLHA